MTDSDALALLSGCKAVSLRHHEAIPSYEEIDREFYVPAWTSKIRVTESYTMVNSTFATAPWLSSTHSSLTPLEAARLHQDYRGSEVHNMMGRAVGTRRRPDIDGRGTPLMWTINAEFPMGTREIEY